MEVASLIISMLAMGFTLYTYFRHDSKLKNQATLINQYQINKLKEERDIARKANLIAEYNSLDFRGGVLTIKNIGKCIAKNVDYQFVDDTGIRIGSNYKPVNIAENQHIGINLRFTTQASEYISIKLFWEDDFNDKNEIEQTFSI